MIRFALVACLLATPALAAETKQQSCAYQGDLVAAIQRARLDGVLQDDVSDAVLATDPVWPENYTAAILLIAPWVYEQGTDDLRGTDLGALWQEMCLKN